MASSIQSPDPDKQRAMESHTLITTRMLEDVWYEGEELTLGDEMSLRRQRGPVQRALVEGYLFTLFYGRLAVSLRRATNFDFLLGMAVMAAFHVPYSAIATSFIVRVASVHMNVFETVPGRQNLANSWTRRAYRASSLTVLLSWTTKNWIEATVSRYMANGLLLGVGWSMIFLTQLVHHESQDIHTSLLEPFVYGESLRTNNLHLTHPTRCDIRLLRLHPRGLSKGTLAASLKRVTIKGAGKYSAISYTWGANSTKTRALIIDGKRFDCTEATHNALYRASSIWTSRLVWIDCICINQSNNEEKGEQVELMRHIYARAREVRVQMTPQSIKSCLEPQIRRTSASIARLASFLRNWEPSHEEIIRYLEAEVDGPFELSEIIDFFANPWFTRVWIIQEVITASCVEVYYNDSYISFGAMALITSALAEHQLLPLLHKYSKNADRARRNALRFNGVLRVRQLHRKYWQYAPYLHSDPDTLAFFRVSMPFKIAPLGILLSEFSSFEATNPRDKVYALLGLVIDKDEYLGDRIWPNYNKPVADAMRNTGMYLAQRRIIFESSSNMGIGLQRTKGTGGLPSWIPDWTVPPVSTPLHIPRSQILKHSSYQATHGSVPYLAWGAEKESLVVSGGCFDRIIQVGPLNNPIDIAEYPETDVVEMRRKEKMRILDWHDRSVALIRQCYKVLPLHYIGVGIEEVIWRTMIGDRSPHERPAPLIFGDYYYKWLEVLRQSLQGNGEVDSEAQDAAMSWNEAMDRCVVGRCIFITARGFIGVGPAGTRDGDEIVFIFGVVTPFVVRHP